MPEAWARLLQNSGISAAEKKKNPQAVVKALEFFTHNQSSAGLEEQEKYMTAPRYNTDEGIIHIIYVHTYTHIQLHSYSTSMFCGSVYVVEMMLVCSSCLGVCSSLCCVHTCTWSQCV